MRFTFNVPQGVTTATLYLRTPLINSIPCVCYSYHTLGGCPLGEDEMWNITWPATNASTTARQKCPGSSEAEGKNAPSN